MDNQKLKQFIIQIAAEAGEYLRHHFYAFKNVIEHDAGNIISNVDLELSEILKRRINQEYPEHDLVVQGEKITDKKSDFVWLVDPLDGSSHFVRNIPAYTVNIALQHQGQTIFGVVNNPQANQLFFAQQDQGAFLNGISIKVSEQIDLSKAFIFVELPERKFKNQSDQSDAFDRKMAIVGELVKQTSQVETFRIGALGQCLVAAGSFDAYVDLSGTSEALSQAASTLILKEAGGEIVDLTPPHDGFIQVMGTNGRLTKGLEKIIHG